MLLSFFMKVKTLFPLIPVLFMCAAPILHGAVSVDFDQAPYTDGQPVGDSGAPGWTFRYGDKNNFMVTNTGAAVSSPNVLALQPSMASWITYTSSESLHEGTEGEISFYYQQQTSFEDGRLVRFDFSANNGGATVMTFIIGDAGSPGRLWYYDGATERSTGTLLQVGNWYKFSISYNATSYTMAIDDVAGASRVFEEENLTLKNDLEITLNLYSLGITVDGNGGVAYFDNFTVGDIQAVPEVASAWQLIFGVALLGYGLRRQKISRS